MASDVASLFAKKKGKKGKKKATNLNLDQSIPKPEEKPKIAQLQEILGGPNPSEDDGWADVVEEKNVVATGGKQVSDLIDMTTLMEKEESTASKLEKKDIKQAFHEARTLKDKKKEETPEPDKGEGAANGAEQPKGLSGNIFGGGLGGGGWQARMLEKELKQREKELSVDNASSFPSLADAMSGPPKPKQRAGVPESSPWVRRGGGSAAAAAIKAALGRKSSDEGGNGETKSANAPPGAPGAGKPGAAMPPAPAPKPGVAEPIWVAPRRGTTDAEARKEDGEEKTTAEDVNKGGGDGATAPLAEPAAEPTNVGREVTASAAAPEKEAAPAAPEPPATEAAAPLGTDKETLVQQFGKKKKKKKKPVDGEPAGGEP